MSEDRSEQTGSCPCCRRRDPREGYACGPCRSRLRSWLSEIPGYFAEAVSLPLGREGGMAKGGPVSGSRERQLPIREDLFDLTHAGGWPRVLDEDQVGHLPVWDTLRYWAGQWADLRNMGEAGMPDVDGLCWWMRERVDEVADEHPEFAAAFDGIKKLNGALMSALGLLDKVDYKRGVPCPKCDMLTLLHRNGDEYITCESCPAFLSFAEYELHVQESWANRVELRRSRVRKMRALHGLLSALRAAGWRHSLRWEDPTRDEDGAPWDDGCRVHVWRRGGVRIEYWTMADTSAPVGAIWYGDEDDGALAGTTLSVSTAWVAEHGFAALHKLTRAAGLLAPVVKEMEKAA